SGPGERTRAPPAWCAITGQCELQPTGAGAAAWAGAARDEKLQALTAPQASAATTIDFCRIGSLLLSLLRSARLGRLLRIKIHALTQNCRSPDRAAGGRSPLPLIRTRQTPQQSSRGGLERGCVDVQHLAHPV